MAGDWIPVTVDLSRSPKMSRLARDSCVTRFEALGLCVSLWSWASDQTCDGRLPGIHVSDLVELVGGTPDFWHSMVKIGWLSIDDNGITITDYDKYLSKSGKARIQAAERKRASRSVTKMSRSERDTNVTREEKRTYINPPTPLQGESCNAVIPSDPNFDERIQPLWDGIQQVCRETEPDRDVPKLTPYRRTYAAKALDLHSVDELLSAWRWMASSGSEKAANVRAKWKGIDTFLRPENITGYVEMAKAESSRGSPPVTPGWTKSAEELWREEDDRRRDAEIRARTPEQIENERRLFAEGIRRCKQIAAERTAASGGP